MLHSRADAWLSRLCSPGASAAAARSTGKLHRGSGSPCRTSDRMLEALDPADGSEGQAGTRTMAVRMRRLTGIYWCPRRTSRQPAASKDEQSHELDSSQ